MFSVYCHAHKMAEEFAQEDRENVQQQIAMYLNNLNYPFIQKSMSCDISIVYFFEKQTNKKNLFAKSAVKY